MIQRFITRRRLDEGLCTSASCEQRCCMVIGIVVTYIAFMSMSANEAKYFADMQELAHARTTFVELPCDGSGSRGTGGTSVVHLTGCKVTQPVVFDGTYPGLAQLSEFQENLPEDGLPGVSFKVNLQQSSRRRGGGFRDVDNIENLHKTHVSSNSSRVGAYTGVSSIFASLPHHEVSLRQSLNFHQQVDSWSDITPPYSSKNMLVKNNHLYTSTNCPDNPYGNDVNLWFEVADANQVVSMIAREPLGQTLQAWTVPGYDTEDLTFTKAGSVEALPMFNEIEHGLRVDFGWERLTLFALTWMSTWCLLFPAYACDYCKRHPDHCGEDCFALCRALPLSLVPSGLVMGFSWGIHRNVLLTYLVAATVLVICVFLLLGYDPWSQPIPDANANVTYASSQGLLQRFPTVRWAGGVRPTVGSLVRIPATNKTGLIQVDDGTDLPYKVVYEDGSHDWLMEMSVEVVKEVEAARTPITQPLDSKTPVAQSLAPSLQEPLLVAESNPIGATPSATSVESRNQRPTISHSLRAIALGAAIGLVVSITIALAARAFLGK